MKIIVTGATGTVGSEVVRQAIINNDVEQITILARRTSSFTHPKIKEILHRDFLNYEGLDNIFRESDACIWCLGISQSRVSKSEYFTITYEYAVAAARAMLNANPNITFLFLSGEGADTTEKSRVRFAKVKGQTENALKAMPFKTLIIFRPGGIYPVVRNANEGIYKKFEIGFVRIMKAVAPFTVVKTDVLAKAMLKSVSQANGTVLIGHKAILAI
jgi:uncharacterized protein YbjT (DUF2867 family)